MNFSAKANCSGLSRSKTPTSKWPSMLVSQLRQCSRVTSRVSPQTGQVPSKGCIRDPSTGLMNPQGDHANEHNGYHRQGAPIGAPAGQLGPQAIPACLPLWLPPVLFKQNDPAEVLHGRLLCQVAQQIYQS